MTGGIPLGATDYIYVTMSADDPDPDYRATLEALAASTYREVVGEIVVGPGWDSNGLYAFAYTQPLPEAYEAVRIHQEANEGVSDD